MRGVRWDNLLKLFEGHVMTIDYQALLKKYMLHVSECEGWSFVENIDDHTRSSVEFTDEEKAVLEKMDEWVWG